MCQNFKSIKSMKENIPYICRRISSEDLGQISWKSNLKKSNYGKEKSTNLQINFYPIPFHSSSAIYFFVSKLLIMQIFEEKSKHG